MKPTDIRGLAKATCAWLAYKHITGFDGTLGEAMLAIPISEYLRTKTSWRLESEVLYKRFGLPELLELSCDFAGKPTHGDQYRFVLETKYLKTGAQNRSRDIAADLIRLSLPPDEQQLKRYFLLAGDSENFESGNDAFLIECKLFDLRQGGGKYIRPKDEVQKESFQRKFPQYKTLISSGKDYVCEYAYLQCGANEKFPVDDKQFFKVMIWSVGRSQRTAADGLLETE